jgi:transcriptional regulator GlxA family with amidase domain
MVVPTATTQHTDINRQVYLFKVSLSELSHMDARVNTVIRKMQQSLHDQPSIPALSKSVNLSPARLRQLFKQHTGQSPKRYLKDRRIREAEEALKRCGV